MAGVLNHQPFGVPVFLSRHSFAVEPPPMHSTSEQQQVSTKCLSPHLHSAVAIPETTLSPGHYDPRLSSETGKLIGNWGLSNFRCETFSRNSIASKIIAGQSTFVNYKSLFSMQLIDPSYTQSKVRMSESFNIPTKRTLHTIL